MNSKEVTARVETVITPVIEGLGYGLVDVEFVNDHGWILRAYIEKADGNISVDDCKKVSRSIEAVLDVEDPIRGRYSLEVSSPGLNRPLKKAADFIKYAGEMIRMRTTEPINGRGNYFGTLKGMDGNDIVISVDGADYRVPLDKLAKARIEYK
jgi:ribosome maturation factor RimP